MFLDALVELGKAEWDDKLKSRCFIYYKTPTEWADTIYKWANESGIAGGSLCTIFELRQGETGADSEFHDIDVLMFHKALKILEKKKKAEYYLKGSVPSDEDGVKFFL